MPTIADVYQPILVYDVNALGLVLWDGAVSTSPSPAPTSTTSTVADTATSTTILAANVNRLGGSIMNDSTAVLYVRYGGGTASATDYSVAIYPNGFHPLLDGYTGALTGIWATDPGTGAARVTELT